jgi:Protein of unknown function with PCYCGC motif
MFKGTKGIAALAGAALLVVAIAYVMSGGSQPSDSAAAASGDAAAHLRVTLDPQGFQGNVRETYEIAARDPALLSQLHCYCGCDKTLGHRSLLDCYRDDHASRCGICMGEARDAEPMAQRGMPIEQIRDTLRARYSHGE